MDFYGLDVRAGTRGCRLLAVVPDRLAASNGNSVSAHVTALFRGNLSPLRSATSGDR